MRSYAHPVHSGAAAALFSAAAAAAAAPSSSSACPRELGIVNRQRPTRLGFGGPLRNRCARGASSSNIATMQRLLIATHRRIPGRGPCLACRSSSTNGGEGNDYDNKLEESPPQDAVLKAISEVSKAEGRVGKTTNMVIGGTVSSKESESQWDAIDQKVNVYPMVREFTAIGTGGDEFVLAMVRAVESITESPAPKVTKKLSSQGKYVSVKIGGITVTSSDQVRAVYDAMRKDVRMKYFL